MELNPHPSHGYAMTISCGPGSYTARDGCVFALCALIALFFSTDALAASRYWVGSAAFDANGTINISAGSFAATSNTTTIERSLIVSSGATFTHNSGTITFDGTFGGDTSIDAPGKSFNKIVINRSFSSSQNMLLLI